MNGEAPAKRATSAELARGFGGTLVTREGTPRRMIARRQLTTTISEQRLAELRKLEAEALARTDQLGARARKPDADFDNYRSNLGTVVLNKLRARMQPAVVEPGQPYYIFGRDENGFLIGPTLNRDEAIGSIPGDSAVEWSSRTVILDEKGNLAGYVLSDGRIEPAHNNGGQGEKEARRGRLFPQSEIDLANVALLNIKGIIDSGIANRQMNLANLLKLKKFPKMDLMTVPFSRHQIEDDIPLEEKMRALGKAVKRNERFLTALEDPRYYQQNLDSYIIPESELTLISTEVNKRDD